MAEKKVMGPASYFPSIEKKYGKPIEHWMKELKKSFKARPYGTGCPPEREI
jgi:hypothetical protein